MFGLLNTRLNSKHSASVLHNYLEENLRTSAPFMANARKSYFTGRSDISGFKATPITRFPNALAPVLSGRYKPTENGTGVCIKTKLNPFVTFSYVVVFGALIFIQFGDYPSAFNELGLAELFQTSFFEKPSLSVDERTEIGIVIFRKIGLWVYAPFLFAIYFIYWRLAKASLRKLADIFETEGANGT